MEEPDFVPVFSSAWGGGSSAPLDITCCWEMRKLSGLHLVDSHGL